MTNLTTKQTDEPIKEALDSLLTKIDGEIEEMLKPVDWFIRLKKLQLIVGMGMEYNPDFSKHGTSSMIREKYDN